MKVLDIPIAQSPDEVTRLKDATDERSIPGFLTPPAVISEVIDQDVIELAKKITDVNRGLRSPECITVPMGAFFSDLIGIRVDDPLFDAIYSDSSNQLAHTDFKYKGGALNLCGEIAGGEASRAIWMATTNRQFRFKEGTLIERISPLDEVPYKGVMKMGWAAYFLSRTTVHQLMGVANWARYGTVSPQGLEIQAIKKRLGIE